MLTYTFVLFGILLALPCFSLGVIVGISYASK